MITIKDGIAQIWIENTINPSTTKKMDSFYQQQLAWNCYLHLDVISF